jgi:hypothetical protein
MIGPLDEAIFSKPRRSPETFTDQHSLARSTTESIMWWILSLIYRHYCRTSLMAMREARFASLA